MFFCCSHDLVCKGWQAVHCHRAVFFCCSHDLVCKGWQAVHCQILALTTLSWVCRQSVTGLALSVDDRTAYSVAKDGSVFQLDVETLRRWVAHTLKRTAA